MLVAKGKCTWIFLLSFTAVCRSCVGYVFNFEALVVVYVNQLKGGVSLEDTCLGWLFSISFILGAIVVCFFISIPR